MAAAPPSPTPPSRAPLAPAKKARGPAAGALLVRKLRALDAELASAIPRVVGASDDEAIHDLRVAIRRLRTLLKLARPIFGRFHADAVRAAFTIVHRATGALRDEEVLDETLETVTNDSPTFVAWKMRRKARERSLRRGVLKRLNAGDLSRARLLLRALVTLPIVPKRDRSAAKLARRAVESARRGVEQKRDVPTDDGIALHDLRIAYKELRYATELLADALPADLAAMAEPASKFQKRLGEIHDADMAIGALKRARGIEPAAHAQALGVLEALRAKRVGKYLAEMAPVVETSESSESLAEASERPALSPREPSPPSPLSHKGRGGDRVPKKRRTSSPLPSWERGRG
jgi:CHAD domain-containing protein